MVNKNKRIPSCLTSCKRSVASTCQLPLCARRCALTTNHDFISRSLTRPLSLSLSTSHHFCVGARAHFQILTYDIIVLSRQNNNNQSSDNSNYEFRNVNRETHWRESGSQSSCCCIHINNNNISSYARVRSISLFYHEKKKNIKKFDWKFFAFSVFPHFDFFFIFFIIRCDIQIEQHRILRMSADVAVSAYLSIWYKI